MRYSSISDSLLNMTAFTRAIRSWLLLFLRSAFGYPKIISNISSGAQTRVPTKFKALQLQDQFSCLTALYRKPPVTYLGYWGEETLKVGSLCSMKDINWGLNLSALRSYFCSIISLILLISRTNRFGCRDFLWNLYTICVPRAKLGLDIECVILKQSKGKFFLKMMWTWCGKSEGIFHTTSSFTPIEVQ